MKDLIERQAAIDALKGLPTWWADEGGFYGGAQPPMTALLDPEDAVSAIVNLPPAQPEPPEDICGECDAWNKYKSEHKTGRWIPCSERSPDEYGEYLVTKHTIGWNCEEYVSNDIAYFDNDGFHKADMVIAWMPLPEPYNPKEKNNACD